MSNRHYNSIKTQRHCDIFTLEHRKHQGDKYCRCFIQSIHSILPLPIKHVLTIWILDDQKFIDIIIDSYGNFYKQLENLKLSSIFVSKVQKLFLNILFQHRECVNQILMQKPTLGLYDFSMAIILLTSNILLLPFFWPDPIMKVSDSGNMVMFPDGEL